MNVLLRGWRRLWARLRLMGRIVIDRLKGCLTAIQLFGALIRWGRSSGVSRHASETPLEYGTRLAAAFPVLHREIVTIVEAYHGEVYRNISLSAATFKTAKAALWRMRHPRYWPGRLKACLWIGR